MSVLALLFGASLATSISLSLLLGALAVGGGLIRSARTRAWGGPISLSEILIVAFFVWTTFSTVLQGAANIGKTISMQSGLLVFYLMSRLWNGTERSRGLTGFAAGAVLCAAVGLLQASTGIWLDPNIHIYHTPTWAQGLPSELLKYISTRADRAIGLRSHPLTFAETLMPAVFLMFGAMVLTGKALMSTVKKRLLVFGFFVVVAGIVVSQSRGVWLGLALGLVVAGFAVPPRLRWGIFGAGLLSVSLLMAASPSYRARLMSIVPSQTVRVSDRQSNETRFSLWRQSLDRIKEKPVLGWGLKKARLITMDPVTEKPRSWSESHNIYLQTAMESGFVGLILFAGILLRLLVSCVQIQGPLRFVFLACAVTFCIAGLTESWTRDKEIALLFWGFLGWVDFLYRKGGTLEA